MADMHTPLPDYTAMTSGDMLSALRDDASKWATAFCQTAKKLGLPDIDEGWMIGWFANAIEQSSAVRDLARASQDAETIKALEAQIATKDAALRDADYALSNLIDGFEFDDDDPDGPCQAEELCGERMCDDCGCLKDKRDAARAALAGSAS